MVSVDQKAHVCVYIYIYIKKIMSYILINKKTINDN
jgi:hypothetical protein